MARTPCRVEESVVRLAVTPGEPAGIGPDIVIDAARRDFGAELVAIADPQLLADRAAQLGLPVRFEIFDPGRRPTPHRAGTLKVLPVRMATPARCGQLDPRNSGYVIATLQTACRLCLSGGAGAMVTAPVHKAVINDAGIAFTGHTEFLAAASGGGLPVMMLTTAGMRVALATTHLPLARVSAALTREGLEEVIRVIDHDLKARFGVPNPRVAVCGLNPHAGEGGYLGTEEREVIEPVIAKLSSLGFNLRGPLPADTAFTPAELALADVVLAMYHDQGLPVVKHAGFGQAVNITLGLPLIRTSVDHGTALPLAGTGRADSSSLVAALCAAIELSAHQRDTLPVITTASTSAAT
jgi:4-hydroxythreonine-4-phosphate dehydrogenase